MPVRNADADPTNPLMPDPVEARRVLAEVPPPTLDWVRSCRTTFFAELWPAGLNWPLPQL